MSAGSVEAARPAIQQVGGGAIPTPALQPVHLFKAKEISLAPLTARIAKELCVTRHYLGSYPGGALINFGVFVGKALLGVAVIGVGPAHVHSFFQGAERQEVACLARLWLDDRLGRNCESRTLAIILRHLRKYQSTIKALVAYSDPMAGHDGSIYRASGFLYLGHSQGTPLYRMPDGTVHHSRSLSTGNLMSWVFLVGVVLIGVVTVVHGRTQKQEL